MCAIMASTTVPVPDFPMTGSELFRISRTNPESQANFAYLMKVYNRFHHPTAAFDEDEEMMDKPKDDIKTPEDVSEFVERRLLTGEEFLACACAISLHKTVLQLQCRMLNISDKGTKDELIDRIAEELDTL